MLSQINQINQESISVMIDMDAISYIGMVENIYLNRNSGVNGNIFGQRGALKTKTAKIIRDRMVKDILEGISLPPLVLGVILDDAHYSELESDNFDEKSFLELVNSCSKENISIIDGMQRTTAIYEALKSSLGGGNLSRLRVEFWIAKNINKLLYRMMVLNTGQVPWDIARQLEVVYLPLLTQIKNQLGKKIDFLSKGNERRSNLNSYELQTENVVELLIIFSSRKRDISLKDEVAQEFIKNDIIENSAKLDFVDYFSEALVLLCDFYDCISTQVHLDNILDPYDINNSPFSGFPMKVGFISALSIHLFSKPGFETKWDEVPRKMDELKKWILKFKQMCEHKDAEADLFCFDYMDEYISKYKGSSSQIGRFQREYFEKAFLTLFENLDSIENLKPCWVAY